MPIEVFIEHLWKCMKNLSMNSSNAQHRLRVNGVLRFFYGYIVYGKMGNRRITRDLEMPSYNSGFTHSHRNLASDSKFSSVSLYL